MKTQHVKIEILNTRPNQYHCVFTNINLILNTGVIGHVFKENLHLLINANDDVTKTLGARYTSPVGSIVTKL